MKMNRLNMIPLVIAAFFVLNACDLEETNFNPNLPTAVPVNLLLPFNEKSLSNVMAGSSEVCAGIFVQYYKGIKNHPESVQLYILNEALYVDWIFNDYYDGPLINLKIMIDAAEKDKNYYYSGIGKILTSLCLGNLSSLYGDIPYSEALQGSLNRSAKYDSQQSIYETIQQLLDNGISDLQQANMGLKPGADDIFFQGDKAKWIKTAYALKARYYLHLTKRTTELSFNPAQKALEAVGNAISSSSEDLVYPYGFTAVESNPLFSFVDLQYVEPNNSFTGLLSAIGDPRKDFIYQKRFGIADFKNGFYTSANSPYLLVTYNEVKLIEAEARLRLNESDPEAQVALQMGTTANISIVSKGTLDPAVVTTYINNNTVLTGTFENKLKTIITQKYISLFASIESWTDYRRTGYPVLTPNEGGDNVQNPGGAIPRRFAYPQKERLYNSNFPSPLPDLQTRFWWDVD